MPENQNQTNPVAEAPAAWANRSLKKAAAIKMEAARDLQAAGEAQELVSQAAGELGGSIDATSEKLDQIRREVKGFREETERLSDDLLAALDRADDELRAIHGGVAGDLAGKVRDAVAHADGEEGEKKGADEQKRPATAPAQDAAPGTYDADHPNDDGKGDKESRQENAERNEAPTVSEHPDEAAPAEAHDELLPLAPDGAEIPHERIKELLAKAKEHGLEGKVNSILVKIFAGGNEETVITYAEGFIEGHIARARDTDTGDVEDIDNVLDEEDATGTGLLGGNEGGEDVDLDAPADEGDVRHEGGEEPEARQDEAEENTAPDSTEAVAGDDQDNGAGDAALQADGNDGHSDTDPSAAADEDGGGNDAPAARQMPVSGGWVDENVANLKNTPDNPLWTDLAAESDNQDQ